MTEAIVLPERDREHERVLGIVFNISPAQAAVLSCLTRGVTATADQLLEYVGAKSHIKVVVSRTRAKLREHNFDIKSKMNVGYWMEPEDRKGVERMVERFLTGRKVA